MDQERTKEINTQKNESKTDYEGEDTVRIIKPKSTRSIFKVNIRFLSNVEEPK